MLPVGPELPLRVLLVEDSPGFAYLVAEYLHEWLGDDCLVEHVEYLQEALHLVDQRRFHIILLDRSLPDSETGQTVQVMRAAAGHVPIVVLSGAPALPVGECTSLPPCRFLEKRLLDADSLARVITEALQ